MILETDRLILRVGTLSDAPSMLALNADPEVVRYTGDVALKDMMEAQGIVRDRLLPQWNLYKMGRFSVCLRDGTYIGWCGLRFSPEENEVDLGYRFFRKYWGQGFATEASKVCLDYGFNTLGLQMIKAEAMPENIPSIKVLQKLGMTFKGLEKNPCDANAYVVYELLKKDFNV